MNNSVIINYPSTSNNQCFLYYTTPYNEINNSRNMDTSLFIDLVYSSIRKLEKLRFS